MKTRRSRARSLGWLAILLTACASTSLDLTWQDPTYEGRPFTKVLVVGSTDNAEHRRLFEDAVVDELKRRGVPAVASYAVIPSERDVTRDTAVEAAGTLGADCVISTRLIRVETKSAQVPVGAPGAGDMERDRVHAPMEPRTTVRQDYRVATLESNLFDARTGKMVWWGRSSAFLTADLSRLSREVGATIVKSLKSAKLL